MEILDKHFLSLPPARKIFVISIGMSFFLIGFFSYIVEITNLVESFLIIVIGMIYSEMIKLNYRLEAIENKPKRQIVKH